jgi:hypothetical protein
MVQQRMASWAAEAEMDEDLQDMEVGQALGTYDSSQHNDGASATRPFTHADHMHPTQVPAFLRLSVTTSKSGNYWGRLSVRHQRCPRLAIRVNALIRATLTSTQTICSTRIRW